VRDGSVSAKQLLADGLKAIEAACPGTLEKLSHIKPRTRRIVARNPKDLFDEAHLVDEYSEQLAEGWWYGTNNSADRAKAWLQLRVRRTEMGKGFQDEPWAGVMVERADA